MFSKSREVSLLIVFSLYFPQKDKAKKSKIKLIISTTHQQHSAVYVARDSK